MPENVTLLRPGRANMQRIRRAAEAHQLAHMNIIIDPVIAFVGVVDTGTLDKGIAEAREVHDLYTLEITRLLGITLAPVTNVPIASITPPHKQLTVYLCAKTI